MTEILPQLVAAGGIGQLLILVASAQIPFMLDWKTELESLSRLHRQLYWVYGGYVVLSIIALGLISLAYSVELAAGSGLARAFCGYVAIFWGVRLALQPVLDVGELLKTPRLRLGYHVLTVMFALLTVIYAWAAVHPAGD